MTSNPIKRTICCLRFTNPEAITISLLYHFSAGSTPVAFAFLTIVGVNQAQSRKQPEQALLFSITDRRVQQLLSRYSGVVDLDCGVAKEEPGSRIAPIPQNENACVGKRAGKGQPRRLIRQMLLPLEETAPRF